MFQCIILNLFLANFVRGIRRKASFISYPNFLIGSLSKNQLDLYVTLKALFTKIETFLGNPSLFFGSFLVQKTMNLFLCSAVSELRDFFSVKICLILKSVSFLTGNMFEKRQNPSCF